MFLDPDVIGVRIICAILGFTLILWAIDYAIQDKKRRRSKAILRMVEEEQRQRMTLRCPHCKTLWGGRKESPASTTIAMRCYFCHREFDLPGE